MASVPKSGTEVSKYRQKQSLRSTFWDVGNNINPLGHEFTHSGVRGRLKTPSGHRFASLVSAYIAPAKKVDRKFANNYQNGDHLFANNCNFDLRIIDIHVFSWNQVTELKNYSFEYEKVLIDCHSYVGFVVGGSAIISRI